MDFKDVLKTLKKNHFGFNLYNDIFVNFHFQMYESISINLNIYVKWTNKLSLV